MKKTHKERHRWRPIKKTQKKLSKVDINEEIKKKMYEDLTKTA